MKTWGRVPAFVLLSGFAIVCVLSASAAEHRVTRLGNPRTAFHCPLLKNADDFAKMIRDMKADLQEVFTAAGWVGTAEDLEQGAQTGQISESTVDAGAHIPYMAYRKHGKPALLRDVVWAGKKPLEVFVLDFQAHGRKYRLYAPKACGNAWLEPLGTVIPIEALLPKVEIQMVTDACVTVPVDVNVTATNASEGAQVVVAVDGQQVGAGPVTGGVFKTQIPAYMEPGQHQVTATLQGTDAAASGMLTIKACPPVCGLTVIPQEIRRGKPFIVDCSASHADPAIQGGLKVVTVEIVLGDAVVDKFDLTPPAFRREDVVIKKAGVYTIRAVAEDAAGQKSSNQCEASMVVTKPPIGLFGAGFVGKERLVDAVYPGGHCLPILGAKFGILPEIAEKTDLELSLGGKIDLDGNDYSSIFADVAIQRRLSRAFFGGGVSFWNLTEEDLRTAALLLQFGVNFDEDGRFSFVGEGRLPFDEFDDLSNNYMIWGGVRIVFFGR
ncbi:MAG: hypothetical protein AB1714_04060 [Acidobacteriota bacterium]